MIYGGGTSVINFTMVVSLRNFSNSRATILWLWWLLVWIHIHSIYCPITNFYGSISFNFISFQYVNVNSNHRIEDPRLPSPGPSDFPGSFWTSLYFTLSLSACFRWSSNILWPFLVQKYHYSGNKCSIKMPSVFQSKKVECVCPKNLLCLGLLELPIKRVRKAFLIIYNFNKNTTRRQPNLGFVFKLYKQLPESLFF